MIHVLHLPVFPEGSQVNPDCINCLAIDDEVPAFAAHIILDTPDTNLAKAWADSFLLENSTIPRDEVALMSCSLERKELPVKLIRLHPENLLAFYFPKMQFHQQVVATFD